MLASGCKKDGYELIIENELPITFYESNISTKIPHQNWHEQVEIIFAVRGKGIITIDSEKFPIKADEFCVISPLSMRSTEGTPDGFSFWNMVISNSFFNYNGINIQGYTYDPIFSDDFLKQKILELRTRYNDIKNPLYHARIASSILEFGIHLVENHVIEKPSAKQNIDYDILLAIGYIKENLKNKITIDEISAQVGLSKYHFQHKFKQITGLSVFEYINSLRCNDACQYLRQPSLSVSDVFHMTPFDNYSYFAKMFKKHIGCSPSEYKKSFDC